MSAGRYWMRSSRFLTVAAIPVSSSANRNSTAFPAELKPGADHHLPEIWVPAR
jgi:hypothetical protein